MHRTPWIYQPLERIRHDLLGEHSLNIIRRAIKLLEEMGLLERRNNPSNGQDKTWQYKLNLDVLDNLLQQRRIINESGAFKSEGQHRSNLNSDPQHNAAVGEEMQEARWEEVAREVELWEREQIKNLLEGVEVSDSANEGIYQGYQLSEAALKDVAINCDELDARLEIVPQAESSMAKRPPSVIALPNSAQEEERIPRVIVTTNVPGAIATSSVPQMQKLQYQSGSDLGVVEQEAIAPTDITQEESESVPRVIVTSRIEGAIAEGRRFAIATSSTSQQRISEPQLPKELSLPVPPLMKPQPVVPKKLSEEEIHKLEDELKRLKINPEPCMNVIKKYWNNVNGAIARVKEAIQQNWCANPTGLFIASCKKGVKPQKM